MFELDVAAGKTKGRKPSEIKKDRLEYVEFETKQQHSVANNKCQNQKNQDLLCKVQQGGGIEGHQA